MRRTKAHSLQVQISQRSVDMLAEYLELDLTSPSGLRWRKCNAGYGAALKNPGDVAGSATNNGVWLVGVNGKRFRCLAVMGKLLERMHSMPIETQRPDAAQEELHHLEYRAGVRIH